MPQVVTKVGGHERVDGTDQSHAFKLRKAEPVVERPSGSFLDPRVEEDMADLVTELGEYSEGFVLRLTQCRACVEELHANFRTTNDLSRAQLADRLTQAIDASIDHDGLKQVQTMLLQSRWVQIQKLQTYIKEFIGNPAKGLLRVLTLNGGNG
jgi:hypothetical protein